MTGAFLTAHRAWRPATPLRKAFRSYHGQKPDTTASAGKSDVVTIHDQKLSRGEGGELHQTAEGDAPVLTTAQGGPVADDQNTLRVGPRGPLVMDDFHFREKLFHFDHERIPERVVHARGYGAHGYFETYDSLAAYTKADLFQRAGENPGFRAFFDRGRQ